ncbi:hypothetical protein [Geobacillus sp. C56-T3]|uniref:DUF7662 domain-containing protein n=1 Tax=Geobacillus sp. (strain C56-T3) TaxID=691437 RepID=UPI0001D584B4|nr:hypothetical protein [Geobacillus sp. C56-T3]ADI27381.1 hypothetical protein GC56T3_2420 [Geobacillus sp. C56-T3]
MTIYQPLGAYLEKQGVSALTLTIDEMESILGFKLPPSARKYREWWANHYGNSQAKGWMDYGWQVSKVELGKKVTFHKIRG